MATVSNVLVLCVIYFVSLVDITLSQSPSNPKLDPECNQYAYTSKIRYCLQGKPCKNPTPCDIPGAVCRYHRNKCNTCDEKWYVNGREVQCANKIRFAECPPGTRRNSSCDACAVVNCPDASYVHKVCRSYGCNDICKAEFYVNNRWQACPDGIYPDRPMVEALAGVGGDRMFDSELPSAAGFVPNFSSLETAASGMRGLSRLGDFPSEGPVCPPEVREFTCANICLDTTCPGYEDATCVVNRCGACRAEYYLNNTRVDCNAKRCDGSPRNRLCDACRNSYCQRYPQANCRMDNCNGHCRAEYFVNNVEVQCNELNLIDSCPGGEQRHVCDPNLCRSYHCPKDKDVICWVDNCGGCKAVWSRKGTSVPTECPGWWSNYNQNVSRPATEAEVRAAWDRQNQIFGSGTIPEGFNPNPFLDTSGPNAFNVGAGTNLNSPNDLSGFDTFDTLGGANNFPPRDPLSGSTVEGRLTSEGRMAFEGMAPNVEPLVRESVVLPSLGDQSSNPFLNPGSQVNSGVDLGWGNNEGNALFGNNAVDQFQVDPLLTSGSNNPVQSGVDFGNVRQNDPFANTLFGAENPFAPPTGSQRNVDSLILQLEEAMQNDVPNFNNMAFRVEPSLEKSAEPNTKADKARGGNTEKMTSRDGPKQSPSNGNLPPVAEKRGNSPNKVTNDKHDNSGNFRNQDNPNHVVPERQASPLVMGEAPPTKTVSKATSTTTTQQTVVQEQKDLTQQQHNYPLVDNDNNNNRNSKKQLNNNNNNDGDKQHNSNNNNRDGDKHNSNNKNNRDGSKQNKNNNEKNSKGQTPSLNLTEEEKSLFTLSLAKIVESFNRLVNSVVASQRGGGLAVPMETDNSRKPQG